MTKNQTHSEPETKPAPKPGLDVMRVANLVSVVALVVFSFLIWRSVDQIHTGLDSRLSGIETKLDKMGGRVNAAAVNTPPRRGPDPSRAYQINIAGRPVEGSPTAPIVIAEFSDFQ
jgi:hypothetical protein